MRGKRDRLAGKEALNTGGSAVPCTEQTRDHHKETQRHCLRGSGEDGGFPAR